MMMQRNTTMSYKNFYYKNEKLKEEGKVHGMTISKTSYRNEWVVF